MKKGQGALEYLLILAGVILVASFTVLVLTFFDDFLNTDLELPIVDSNEIVFNDLEYCGKQKPETYDYVGFTSGNKGMICYYESKADAEYDTCTFTYFITDNHGIIEYDGCKYKRPIIKYIDSDKNEFLNTGLNDKNKFDIGPSGIIQSHTIIHCSTSDRDINFFCTDDMCITCKEMETLVRDVK